MTHESKRSRMVDIQTITVDHHCRFGRSWWLPAHGEQVRINLNNHLQTTQLITLHMHILPFATTKHLKLIKTWDILIFQQCDPTARVHRWSQLYTMAVRFRAAWKFDDLVSNRRLFNGRQCRIYPSKNRRKNGQRASMGSPKISSNLWKSISTPMFHAKQA